MNNKKLLKPKKDLTGHKQFKIQVISFCGYKEDSKKRRHAIWNCKCECGKIFKVRDCAIKNGQQSCGCELLRVYKDMSDKCKKINTKAIGIAAKNHLYTNYRMNAKNKNNSFKLTKEEFLNLTSQNCYYCGVEPKQIMHKPQYNGDYIYNGIDRLDNNIGYELNNVVPCCGICNKAKRDLTQEQFKEWIERLICHQSN